MSVQTFSNSSVPFTYTSPYAGTFPSFWPVEFSPAVGTRWLLSRCTVEGPIPIAGRIYCYVYLDNRFLLGTQTGYYDSADGTPVVINPSQVLQFQFTPDPVFEPVFGGGDTIVWSAHIQVEATNQ